MHTVLTLCSYTTCVYMGTSIFFSLVSFLKHSPENIKQNFHIRSIWTNTVPKSTKTEHPVNKLQNCFISIKMILKCLLFSILFLNANASIKSIFKDFTSSLKGDKDKAGCVAPKEVCDENQLMLQLAKLYIISPERIILQLTSCSVNEMCKELKLLLNKLNHQFQSCTPLPKENLYMKLLAGAHILEKKVCEKDNVCLSELIYFVDFLN